MTNPAHILVAYATKHGSTAEIAQSIGAALRDEGIEADVRPAHEVHDVAGFDAIVVGSAVYHGKWQGEAVDLLKRFERDLAGKHTYLFSSGPTGGSVEADAKVAVAIAGPTVVAPPEEVAKHVRRVGAVEHATFPGRITEEMSGLLERWVPRGDWRNIEAQRAWARSIARREARPAEA
jgi:menaquinone-dependent protoporphyrinogen oxidase